MLAKIRPMRPFYVLTASAAVSRSLILAIGAATLFLGIGWQCHFARQLLRRVLCHWHGVEPRDQRRPAGGLTNPGP